MKINLYMRHAKTKALGPDVRYALWTQGCARRCHGCLSPDSRDPDKGEWEEVSVIAEEILQQKGIEGITISGGEPFLQAQALCELVTMVRKERDLGVIVYTGYTFGELQHMENAYVRELLCQIDLLVDGEYIEELNDGKSLRGSANQKIILLSKRYAGQDGLYGADGREIELYFQNDRMRMVGIPSKDMLEKIKKECSYS